MYDKTDPRATLASKDAAAAPKTGLVAKQQEGHFYRDAPQIDDGSGQTWLLRGHNFVLSYSRLNEGANLARTGQPDEYAVLLPEAGAVIEWNGQKTEVPGWSLAFVPAGDSKVTLAKGGAVVRLFTVQATDLTEQCSNASGYDEERSHIPDLETWPTPSDGWKVRHYTLDVAPSEGRFGRIFRCSTIMVNVLYPFDGPRDPSKMSPHHHDDFEQCSLALRGAFDHHLRWPWTTDMADWRDDTTVTMGAPSALVIPPPVIHTTRAVDAGENLLVDIFCPPRADFSERPGWVLNAEDYPMPTQGKESRNPR